MDVNDLAARVEFQTLVVFDFASSYLSSCKVAPEIIAKGIKGTALVYQKQVTGAQITGLYIPLYAELQQKIEEHLEEKPLEELIDISLSKDVKFWSNDHLYCARLNQEKPYTLELTNHSVGFNQLKTLDITLHLVWDEGKTPYLTDKAQVVQLALAPSYDITIETFFDGGYPQKPDASFKSKVYTNRSFVSVAVSGKLDPTFGGYFSNDMETYDTYWYRDHTEHSKEGKWVYTWAKIVTIQLAIPLAEGIVEPALDNNGKSIEFAGQGVNVKNESEEVEFYSVENISRNLQAPSLHFTYYKEQLKCIIEFNFFPSGPQFRFDYGQDPIKWFAQMPNFYIFYSIDHGPAITQYIDFKSTYMSKPIEYLPDGIISY